MTPFKKVYCKICFSKINIRSSIENNKFLLEHTQILVILYKVSNGKVDDLFLKKNNIQSIKYVSISYIDTHTQGTYVIEGDFILF